MHTATEPVLLYGVIRFGGGALGHDERSMMASHFEGVAQTISLQNAVYHTSPLSKREQNSYSSPGPHTTHKLSWAPSIDRRYRTMEHVLTRNIRKYEITYKSPLNRPPSIRRATVSRRQSPSDSDLRPSAPARRFSRDNSPLVHQSRRMRGSTRPPCPETAVYPSIRQRAAPAARVHPRPSRLCPSVALGRLSRLVLLACPLSRPS